MQSLTTQEERDVKTPSSINLILVVHLDSEFHATRYHISQTQQLIIGRGDPNKNWQPDVDMQTYGGQALGVSRLHAAIKHHHSRIYMIDLFSYNGTFVNEVMLFPYQPHPVSHGDTIRVGQMKIQFRFAPTAQTARV